MLIFSRLNLALLPYLYLLASVSASPSRNEQLLITSPLPQPTHCPTVNLLARQASCSFGQCGEECLSQGAFCCGPAGTKASAPLWICDNGACITSVRGTTGIVDCYDPDNPLGTTQSCLDLKATTLCNPTDRCFTCDAEAPYCQWQTYIAYNSPTLRWFSCNTVKASDLTFLAATITPGLLSTSNSLSPYSVSSSTPTPTSTSTTAAASNSGGNSGLSTGAIIGIAVGGGLALIALVAFLVYFILQRRSARPPPPQEMGTDTTNPHIMNQNQPPTELDSQAWSPAGMGPGVGQWPPEGYASEVEAAEIEARKHGYRDEVGEIPVGELSAEGTFRRE